MMRRRALLASVGHGACSEAGQRGEVHPDSAFLWFGRGDAGGLPVHEEDVISATNIGPVLSNGHPKIGAVVDPALVRNDPACLRQILADYFRNQPPVPALDRCSLFIHVFFALGTEFAAGSSASYSSCSSTWIHMISRSTWAADLSCPRQTRWNRS